jgi:hypothetical protein
MSKRSFLVRQFLLLDKPEEGLLITHVLRHCWLIGNFMFILRIFILFLVDSLTSRNQQQRKAWER